MLQHNEEGVVSMSNYGKPNTNNSQFFITAAGSENLNGINVVVGRVIRGLGIVAEMEQNCNDEGDPTAEIKITDCGELMPEMDWGVECSDETNDKLPTYPQDWTGQFSKHSVSWVIIYSNMLTISILIHLVSPMHQFPCSLACDNRAITFSSLDVITKHVPSTARRIVTTICCARTSTGQR